MNTFPMVIFNKYGAPPHRAITFGFPPNQQWHSHHYVSAVSLMDDSQSTIAEEQLKELHIKVR